ncbi:MAG: anti-sigma factor [Terriglobia bacterium]
MAEMDLKRWLRAKRLSPAVRGWRCPDENDIAAYVDGKIPAPAREHMERHLAGCDYCLGQVAALLRLEDSPMPESVPPALLARARDFASAPASPSVWPIVRWGAVAAVTACIAVVTTLWYQRQDRDTFVPPVPAIQSPASQPPATSTPAPLATTPREVRTVKPAGPSFTLLAPREGAAVPGGNLDFRWTPASGSLYYEVRVMTVEGDLVWEGRAEGNETRLPGTVQLVAGARYFVSVRALMPDGKALASPVVGFTAQ